MSIIIGHAQHVAERVVLWQQGVLAEQACLLKLFHVEQVAQVVNPREESKIGRNDPCPCGSGKKFKQCRGGTTLH